MPGIGFRADAIARMLRFARRPELLAFLPAATLGAYWLGGESMLIATALVIPLLYALGGLFVAPAPVARDAEPRDSCTGLALRDAAIRRIDAHFEREAAEGLLTACIALLVETGASDARRHGSAGSGEILRRSAERIQGVLRGDDMVVRLEGACFAVILAPSRRADLESVLQVAARIQEAVEYPISLEARTVHATCTIGFCLSSRAPAPDGESLLDAALSALEDARHNGAGSIRAHTEEMRKARADLLALRRRIAPALDNGEVRPFYQPQISTDTGEISGLEALARWVHPDRGVLVPDQFLPELLDAGLSERLGEVMLNHALRALRSWDAAGLAIPSVAVNFAPEELRNPRLPEKVQWELDRYELAPERLTVEILETVVAEAADDVIVQTLGRLAQLGCCIDLDDFGTGHASMTNIRRFAVTRIKIDRSFVTRLDEDRAQQRIVAAILSMAERLGLETIAEGVETAGEHAMLAQLGCAHVQGYAIARPMPGEEIPGWIEAHRLSLGGAVEAGKRIG